MDSTATATPQGAPESEEATFDAMMAKLAAEDDAPAQPEVPQAEAPDEGDAEEAPNAADEAETADKAEKAKEGDEPALPVTVKVKVNGEDLEVPLDEALKGYSRTEDYKAKTAALATERRQYADNLQAVAERFIQFDPVLSEARSTDWASLARSDPAEYIARKAALEERQALLAHVQGESDRVKQEATAERLSREYELLTKAMPQLADPEGAAKFDGELRKYLKAGGLKFTDAEISGIVDHRYYLLAEKARKFDALQAARASLPAKKTAPETTVKTVRPGNAEAPRSSPRKPPAHAKMSEVQAWLARNV